MREENSMNISPYVSIIIPCFNGESSLPATLESVINQTNLDFELIFVDDGSYDNSLQIATNILSKTDINYSIYSIKNGGVSSARNFGLNKASGKYIYFLDSDDIINHELVEILKQNTIDEDVILFKYLHHDTETRLIKNHKVLDGKEAIKYFCLTKIDIHICSLFFKRTYLEKYHISFTIGARYGEDIEFIIKSLYHTSKVRLLDKTLFRYINRENSTVSYYSVQRLDSLDSVNRILNYIVEENKCIQLKPYLSLILYYKIDYNMILFIRLNNNDSLLASQIIKQSQLYSRKWFRIREMLNIISHKNMLLKLLMIKYMTNLYFKLYKVKLYVKAQYNLLRKY